MGGTWGVRGTRGTGAVVGYCCGVLKAAVGFGSGAGVYLPAAGVGGEGAAPLGAVGVDDHGGEDLDRKSVV